jgi:short-subunit dehydrogenase
MSALFNQYLMSPRTAWITGASSGIGREIALQLAEAGHRVVISARQHAALDQIANQYPENMMSLPMDMIDAASMEQASTRLAQLVTSLDLVILNAGICEYLDNGDIDLDLIQRVMDVNFTGTLRVAKIAIPLLQKSSQPSLYIVSSQVTRLALTRSGAYGASKSALEYFFRCLRIDSLSTGIFIGLIRPGFVKTPLTDRNNFSMPWLWTADKAARHILKGIDRCQAEMTFPLALNLLLSVFACLPHAIWAALSQSMRKPAEEKRS